MKINKTELIESNLPYDGVEYDNITDQRRWITVHEIVFKWKDGKFYRTWYEVGSTECQEIDLWEGDEEIECIEVEKKIVQKEEWVEIK